MADPTNPTAPSYAHAILEGKAQVPVIAQTSEGVVFAGYRPDLPFAHALAEDGKTIMPVVHVANPGGEEGNLISSIVAGDDISVDNTDPANPVVSNTAPNVQSDWAATEGPEAVLNKPATIVESIVAGDDISVDNTDPANPVVNYVGVTGGQVDSLTAGTGISVDSTDPTSPEVSLAQAVQDEIDKIPGIEQAIGDIGTALDIINGEVVL